MPPLFRSVLTPRFFPSSSVSLSCFILAVTMDGCLGKHSCMSFTFSIVMLNCLALAESLYIKNKLHKVRLYTLD